MIPNELIDRLKHGAVRKRDRVGSLRKDKLISKFNKLSSSNKISRSDRRWVIILSNKQLTTDETTVQSKGLRFAKTHNETDKTNFIAAIELTVERLRNVTR